MIARAPLLSLLALACVACSDGGNGPAPVLTPGADAGRERPTDGSTGSMPEASLPIDAGVPPSCGEDTQATGALVLELPLSPPRGTPFVIAARSEGGEPLDAAARVCLDGKPVATLTVHRGVGSVALSLDDTAEHTLEVRAPTHTALVVVQASQRTQHTVSGALAGKAVRFAADQDHVLSGDVVVPRGVVLTIDAGSHVLFAEDASLEVDGTLHVEGTALLPVLFSRAGAADWGGLRLLPGSKATLAHAWFTRGGADGTRAFGHSKSQPVLWVEGATLTMQGGGVVDNPGKAFGADDSSLTLSDMLVSRVDTGGEFTASHLTVEGSHVLEIPDADGKFDDDDNDGMYVAGAKLDADGAAIESVIRDSVFALGEDDAIDHNGAQLRVEHVWIEGFRHEGIAASNGRRMLARDVVVRGCEQGIEAGYGGPEVLVEHALLTGNDVGLRYGDSYDWDTSGSLTVSHSVSVDNRMVNVRNYVNQLMGPRPDSVFIRCSMVDDDAWDGVNGNLAGSPTGDLQHDGCASGPVLAGTSCEAIAPGPRTCF